MNKVLAKIAGWAVWGLLILLVLSLIQNIGKVNTVNRQIAVEKAKLAKIQADNNKLQAQLSQAQSPEFVEKKVRDELGLGKTGEAEVVLPDDDTLKTYAPQMPVEVDSLPDPNWKKWEKLFF